MLYYGFLEFLLRFFGIWHREPHPRLGYYTIAPMFFIIVICNVNRQ
jgi:hypothetical protein